MANLGYIRRETVDGVATIFFNKPKHNVMNIAMIGEINCEIESILKDTALKCLVFKAEGSNWCAGVEVSDHKPGVVKNMIVAFAKMFTLIHQLEIPTVAVVHGACLGGGMEIAIACDVVIALEDTLFGQPEIKLGFFPPYSVVRLPELVGRARAIEICTSGKRYKAKDALQMGMISQVIEGSSKEVLNKSADNFLREIKECSPLIIRFNKRAIVRSLNMEFIEAFEEANKLFLNELMKTDDVLEGLASFEQKRKPMWLNR